MAEMNETPSGNRIRIAFFGLRNAGKSTLANAFTGQPVAIVSEVAGTTTDPVSKAMEIPPLGPCLVTDTAGLDDEGELGALRVARTLAVLATTDIAVWVWDAPASAASANPRHEEFLAECRRRGVTVLEYHRGESVGEFRRRVAAARPEGAQNGLLEGLVGPGDRVLCVTPIDASAPKGRLILPQQQVVRDCLDRGASCTVCQPDRLDDLLAHDRPYALAVTDSQAFAAVKAAFARAPSAPRLTSFSILFARQKGDLAAYADGLRAIASLRDGDLVLVAEGCTHHRQCDDIGTVKVPKALERLSGRRLGFAFAAGSDFPDLTSGPRPALVVQCGGCMLTRREVMRRIGLARAAGVPVVNYGLVLAAANGIRVEEVMP